MKNIFYFNYLNIIGGIETFFYNLAQNFKGWDITIYYQTGNIEQIKRLKKYVRVKKYKGEHIKCDKAFFCLNLEIIDNVEAKEYIQVLHGDYKAMNINPEINNKITKYYGVSQVVCDSFKELTGIEAEVIYNPIIINKPKKILNLISATRLTADKGRDRIIKFAKILDNANIPYLWIIFTDNKEKIDNQNVIYMKPRLDITNYIANADYLVQLSDAEGYCYSVVESLSVGTPVIVTDMPVMEEIGVNKENGFILDFNLSNVVPKEIYLKEFNFNYIPKQSKWEKILEKGKSKYEEELKMKYKVRALKTYEERNIKDVELDRVPKQGEEWIVDYNRKDVLCGENEHGIIFVEVIEEIKETEEETKEAKEIKETEVKQTKTRRKSK